MSTPETPEPVVEPEPKPKRRKRRTKAEIEAARAAKMAAEADKPLLEPKAWIIFGGLLLMVGLCIYLDPVGFEQADSSNSETWLKIILEILIVVLGKNPVSLALGLLGGLAVLWGIRGWLREKSGAKKEKPVS